MEDEELMCLSSGERCDSPVDTALMQRKVRRQALPEAHFPRPRRPPHSLSPVKSRSSEEDSPRLIARLEVLRMGNDPSSRSSPIGTSLLARKVARQVHPTPTDFENLPGQDMWSLEQLQQPATDSMAG